MGPNTQKMPTVGLTLNHGIPLGDANWMQGLNSPFYNASHVAWQAKVREFCETHGEPVIGAWDLAAVRGEHDKAGQYLKDLMKFAIPGGSEEIMLNLAARQFKFVDKKKAKL